MSDYVPKSGGGFLKGFLAGGAVSVAAICAAWVVLPGAGDSPAAGVVAPAAEPDKTGISPSANLTLPQSPSAPEVAGTSNVGDNTTETSAAVAVSQPSALDTSAISGTDSLASVDGTGADKPQIQSAPTLPSVDTTDAPPTTAPGAPTAISRTAPQAPSTDRVVRPPKPEGSSDPFAIPQMPQDQTVPAFPATDVPQRAPFSVAQDDDLDASLPQAEAATTELASAVLPSPSAAQLPSDANSFDTRSARVDGSRASVPERALPPSTQTVTIVPIAAPTPPRLPRATLAAPQSSFPDPVSLTLPGVDSSPAPAPTPSNDDPEAAEANFDPERSFDSENEKVARLDAITPERKTVGSLIDNRRAPESALPEADEDISISAGPAFVANAADFTPEGDLPCLAIILEDVGEEGISRRELVELGTRVTFAINPEREDALSAQTDYRFAGFEVLVLVPASGDLHIGAATDPEQLGPTTAAIFKQVPFAVGMIDRPAGNIFRSARLVSSLADTLKQTGHGLLVHEQFGVNRTIESLRAQNVPSASVLRVIDAQRNPDAIRRSLDRAALEASKSGAAVVYGRTYPETISALGIWSLSRAARGVDFAPVTATINRR